MSAIAIVVLVIHVLVSFAMISLILLQNGRGGGMGDVFGGGMQGGGALGGTTSAERFFQRMTVFAGIAFAITTIALSVLLG